jgi:hypothetical protein
MGAERDSAGQTGSGLTGDAGRDLGGRSPMGDPTGSGEVHTGLHSGRGSGEELSALGFAGDAGTSSGVRERVMDRARTVAGTVRERAETLGHRAGEAATSARGRISDLSERTNRTLEQRGLLSRLEENPLPALAVAFGVGFLLAGGGRSEPGTPSGRVRRELRNALMAGLTAGAAQATRGFLQTAAGPDGVLGSLLGGRGDELGEDRTTRRPRSAGTRGRMSGGLSGETETRPPSHRENV